MCVFSGHRSAKIVSSRSDYAARRRVLDCVCQGRKRIRSSRICTRQMRHARRLTKKNATGGRMTNGQPNRRWGDWRGGKASHISEMDEQSYIVREQCIKDCHSARSQPFLLSRRQLQHKTKNEPNGRNCACKIIYAQVDQLSAGYWCP